MQQLLVAIVQQFPHQALWAMAVVVKSTIRARQVCGAEGRHISGAHLLGGSRLLHDRTFNTTNVSTHKNIFQQIGLLLCTAGPAHRVCATPLAGCGRCRCGPCCVCCAETTLFLPPILRLHLCRSLPRWCCRQPSAAAMSQASACLKTSSASQTSSSSKGPLLTSNAFAL